MSKTDFLTRHQLIINKLNLAPASLQELKNYVEANAYGEAIKFSERTFLRDKEDILTLYNVHIEYDKSKRKYTIINQGADEIDQRLLDSYNTTRLFTVAKESPIHCIEPETRKALGSEHFHGIVHAIQNQVELVFDYHSYIFEEHTKHRTVRPYLLKEFRGRWYVLATDAEKSSEKLKTFGLDRMSNLIISTKKFEPNPRISIKEKYLYVFGISIDEENTNPEKVLLSFSPMQGNYIKSYPLHRSQNVLKDDENECLIELKLCINHDFLIELQSLGSSVKVLAPQGLKDMLLNDLKATLELYQ